MSLSDELHALLQYDDLEFIARTIAEGYLRGLHPSLSKGVGTDFNQYKVYQQGDDTSKIDWKLFARSDKYFVREAERESERPIHFVVDISASMGFTPAGPNHLSKLDYARYLTGALSYIAQQQSDPFSLTLINNQGLEPVGVGSGRKHWYRAVNQLQKHASVGEFAQSKWQQYLSRLARQSCLVVFISDAYQEQTEITDCLAKIKHQKNEVLFFHLHSKEELNFDYKGFIQFEDLETGQQKRVSAKAAKIAFQTEQDVWLRQVQRICDEHGVQQQRLNVDEDFTLAMTRFLKLRASNSI